MKMAASPPQPQLTAAGMAQEEGWPLGLNARPRPPGFSCNRRRTFSASVSHSSSLLTASTCLSSSTDFDSESTGSSYSTGNSITLGSLMGVSNTEALSQRPPIGVTTVPETSRHKKHHCKSRRKWCSVLCSKLTTDAISMPDAPPSLGHFLQAERRIGSVYKRRHNPLFYSPHNISHEVAHISEANCTHF